MIMSADVLRLAASGARIPQIAQALGCTERQAVDQLLVAVRDSIGQALDHEGNREVELTHLDMLRSALMPAALRGDPTAARLLVRIHSARALLLGLVSADEAAADQEAEVNELAEIRARREARRGASSR